MKKLLALVAVLFFSQVQAQVQFQQISLGEAISKAATSGKLVFAQFITETCRHCNEVADVSLATPELGAIVNKKCIPIKIEIQSADRQQFKETYNPNNSLGTFFISGDGELIHRFGLTTTRYAEYISQVNKAYNKIVEGKASLKELNEEWKRDPLNFPAMEANLIKRQSLALPTDSMLEEYVQRLPPDSFQSLRTLRFITMQSPTLFSNAYKLLRKDFKNFDSAWKTMPAPIRLNANSRTIFKSLQKAIHEKNLGMALRVASFARSTYRDINSLAAQKAFYKQVLNYYVGINDSVNILKQAETYYDKYVMTASLSEMKVQDSIMQQAMLRTSKADTIKDAATGKISIRRSVSFVPRSAFVANELLQGVRLLYNYSSGESHLSKALEWAKRSIDLFDSPSALDVYAKLLYRLPNKEEAILWEEKAHEASKKQKYFEKTYLEALDKMKRGEEKLSLY